MSSHSYLQLTNKQNLNIYKIDCFPWTHSRSDSHVADTKFDSDDKSSLLIKCQRVPTVADI